MSVSWNRSQGRAADYHRVKSESSDQKQNSNSNAQFILGSFPFYLRFVFHSVRDTETHVLLNNMSVIQWTSNHT